MPAPTWTAAPSPAMSNRVPSPTATPSPRVKRGAATDVDAHPAPEPDASAFAHPPTRAAAVEGAPCHVRSLGRAFAPLGAEARLAHAEHALDRAAAQVASQQDREARPVARGGAAGVVDVGEVARVEGDVDARRRAARPRRGRRSRAGRARWGGPRRGAAAAGRRGRRGPRRSRRRCASAATARTMALACAGLGAARGRPRSSGSVQSEHPLGVLARPLPRSPAGRARRRPDPSRGRACRSRRRTRRRARSGVRRCGPRRGVRRPAAARRRGTCSASTSAAVAPSVASLRKGASSASASHCAHDCGWTPSAGSPCPLVIESPRATRPLTARRPRSSNAAAARGAR